MRKQLLFLIALLVISVSLYAQVSVKVYYRKDGTYVQPHMRSSPDKNPYNNYSYPGNTNPYTGKTATGNEATYLEKYNNTNVSGYTYIPKTEERIYLYHNKSGNKSDQYLYKYEVSDIVIRYRIYNANDYHIGYVVNYYDGDTFVYDLKNNLIENIKPDRHKRFPIF